MLTGSKPSGTFHPFLPEKVAARFIFRICYTIIPSNPWMRGLVQDVTIPSLGMAMTGAILTRWYKEPGETGAAGEAIAEIETDKSAVDLESPADGVLGPHLVAEGDEVPVGAAVTRVLDEAAAPVPDEAAQRAAAPVPREEAPVPYDPDPFPVPAGSAGGGDGVPAAGTAFPHARAPHKLSPRKRMLARLAAEAAAQEKAQGTERTATVPAPPALPADGGLTGRRAAVAAAVAESWRTVPHFAVQREIDASDADACLAAMRAAAPEATYTDLLLRAFALAVGAVAWLAAGGGQPGGGAPGDVGLAVATPEGVMMPVVPGVPALAVPALVAARQAAVRRGREGRLTARDLASGAVGAVSNLGARGVDAFTGIVPAGRRLLLTTGRIAGRPVVIDGRLAVRTTLIATLNVDHRYFDGDRAADVLDAFDREFRALHAWAGEGD
jgi:pyruvate dehydrogenase E2 component (dihydrolipoyllysine-residue acetyltransferase)